MLVTEAVHFETNKRVLSPLQTAFLNRSSLVLPSRSRLGPHISQQLSWVTYLRFQKIAQRLMPSFFLYPREVHVPTTLPSLLISSSSCLVYFCPLRGASLQLSCEICRMFFRLLQLPAPLCSKLMRCFGELLSPFCLPPNDENQDRWERSYNSNQNKENLLKNKSCSRIR